MSPPLHRPASDQSPRWSTAAPSTARQPLPQPTAPTPLPTDPAPVHPTQPTPAPHRQPTATPARPAGLDRLPHPTPDAPTTNPRLAGPPVPRRTSLRSHSARPPRTTSTTLRHPRRPALATPARRAPARPPKTTSRMSQGQHRPAAVWATPRHNPAHPSMPIADTPCAPHPFHTVAAPPHPALAPPPATVPAHRPGLARATAARSRAHAGHFRPGRDAAAPPSPQGRVRRRGSARAARQLISRHRPGHHAPHPSAADHRHEPHRLQATGPRP
ncbi:WAS/WASL-interacting protein [Actinokineospora iranica]|uniref:WAS/WASL-interacting protein n=1 Tax=Actinokineospora iranica TaxID=1271860 RepID=A0A1G6WS98_9PSEU|nr:WAS/WASL-interacting protein [Actinokineospora iranica]